MKDPHGVSFLVVAYAAAKKGSQQHTMVFEMSSCYQWSRSFGVLKENV